MTKPDVALVSDARSAPLDSDLAPLLDALDDHGQVVYWTDPEIDWSSYRLAVIRSPWDYVSQRDAFCDWAERTSAQVRLANSADVVRWNSDKHYLAELHQVGLPITPTIFLEPGVREWGLPADRDIVVKPTVSAGARDTGRYAATEAQAAVDHVMGLLGQGRGAMVQPYLPRVETEAETALVFVDGKFSHALAKAAILATPPVLRDGLFVPELITAREATPAQRDLAEAVLTQLHERFGPLLYARVDLVPHDDGQPVILEVELVEPSLFHAQAPGSAERFAAAIRRWAID